MRHWQLISLCLSLLSFTFCSTPSCVHAAEAYRLGPGDMLAVIVHGVVGKFGRAPVHYPKADEDFEPAMGFPYPVLADGCLKLPLVDAIDVQGLTVIEAQRAVSEAYVAAKVQTKPHMVALTLMSKRQVHVLVAHSGSQTTQQSIEKVSLSVDQATLLGAVARAGAFDRHAQVRVLSPGRRPATGTTAMSDSGRLQDGAIVELRSPARYRYFTGGLVAGGEHLLPVSGSMNALQAIAAAGGYRQHGIIPPHQLTVLSRNGPTRSFPLAQVLANPNGFQVLPGDMLIVR
ncbi:MAG: polysaccharide biosynthesis/export family protein [Pirellulaceae bacterium]|jgi:protein involved in polysaccharide export with SLBB domain|nr:polysaccharide biosynthesis/export family protein [Pirellulaceae bacterium]